MMHLHVLDAPALSVRAHMRLWLPNGIKYECEYVTQRLKTHCMSASGHLVQLRSKIHLLQILFTVSKYLFSNCGYTCLVIADEKSE